MHLHNVYGKSGKGSTLLPELTSRMVICSHSCHAVMYENLMFFIMTERIYVGNKGRRNYGQSRRN